MNCLNCGPAFLMSVTVEFPIALEAAEADELRAAVELALAKFYEHRRKDLERALRHAAATGAAEGEEATARRVERLERRIARRT